MTLYLSGISCNPRANIQIAIGASTNTARTIIWGDGTSGTSIVTVNNVRNTTRTVYGRIPALQDVRAGSYSETLTVTVTY